jgi:hypothetical protein
MPQSHRNVTDSPSSRAVGRGDRHASADRSDWYHVRPRLCAWPESLLYFRISPLRISPHPSLVTVSVEFGVKCKLCFVTSQHVVVVTFRTCWHSVRVVTLAAYLTARCTSYCFTFVIFTPKSTFLSLSGAKLLEIWRHFVAHVCVGGHLVITKHHYRSIMMFKWQTEIIRNSTL